MQDRLQFVTTENSEWCKKNTQTENLWSLEVKVHTNSTWNYTGWQCQEKQLSSVLCRQPTHLVLYKHYSHPHRLDIRALRQHVSSNLFLLIFQGISTSSSKSVLSFLSQCCWQLYTRMYLVYFTSLNHFMVNTLYWIFYWTASFPVISTNRKFFILCLPWQV